MCRAVSSSSSATPNPIRNVCAEGNCRELCRSRALGRAQCPPDRHRHARLPFVANDGGVWQRPRPSTWKTVRRRLGTPEHIVYIFPLWLGTMPALLKRVPRTGDAFGHRLFKSRAGQGRLRQDLAQGLGTGARDQGMLHFSTGFGISATASPVCAATSCTLSLPSGANASDVRNSPVQRTPADRVNTVLLMRAHPVSCKATSYATKRSRCLLDANQDVCRRRCVDSVGLLFRSASSELI